MGVETLTPEHLPSPYAVLHISTQRPLAPRREAEGFFHHPPKQSGAASLPEAKGNCTAWGQMAAAPRPEAWTLHRDPKHRATAPNCEG